MRRYDPKLRDHRNYETLYKPLLELLDVRVTVIKVKGHGPGRSKNAPTVGLIEQIFSLVDKATRKT